MYLKKSKTKDPLPFVYSFSYDVPQKAFVFRIHPAAIAIFDSISFETLQIKYCKEKLNYSEVETSLERNFGINNCSRNEGVADGLIRLSFPVIATYAESETICETCKGEKKDWNDNPCFHCRATGKEFDKTNNVREICASMYILTNYLNWWVMKNDDSPVEENEWGNQAIFLQLGPLAGIGGECSRFFIESIAPFEELNKEREKAMFELHQYIDGAEAFPGFPFFERVSQFRCENSGKGFYVEVPGQNGCSIHMGHNSDKEFSCHNIDRPQQQVCLLAGLGQITGSFYELQKNRPS
ncbi:MAG: hypothetical protein V4478_02465 [Patescibacteria group bacterium]